MKVAYLTMSYDLEKTYSLAIPGCNSVSHNHHKVLYLMHQQPFPTHIGDNHDLGVEIREFNVDGIEGYGWWLLKLKRFLDVCDEEYFVWWDEDDYYEHGYVYKLLCAISDDHPLAWNMHNYEVKRGSIHHREYTSGMGTLGGRVDALREPVAELLAKWPDGRLRVDTNKQPVDCDYKGQWSYCGGALDAYMKRLLMKRYDIAEHTGMRYMVFHSKTNTHGNRKPEENVDYVS